MESLRYLTYIFALAMAVLLTACQDVADPDGLSDPQPKAKLVINISGLPQSAMSRAANDDEAVNTLRVIIVRPDGMVEANRLIAVESGHINAEDVMFEVRRNELKTVLLIANEDTGYDYDALDTIDNAALDAPALYPDSPLNSGVGDIGRAPMTAVYRLSTSIQYARKLADGTHLIEYNLTLLRSYASISLSIENRRATPVTLSNINLYHASVSDGSLFPHVTTADSRRSVHYLTALGPDLTESGTAARPEAIDGTIGPMTRWYADHFIAAEASQPLSLYDGSMTVSAGSSVSLPLVRCLESLPSAGTATPYTLSVSFDGSTLVEALDNLTSLPRNTRVDIKVVITSNDKTLLVEVAPYGVVDLKPEYH